ncbi:MAG TPA: hypothetical protein VFJ94_05960, partial [Intrasporangium sp.]|nr:hypothetical protein [Intrasporangium sp.]
ATNVGALPGNVYRGGSTGTAVSDELFRVGLTSTGVSSKPVAVPNGAVPWSSTRGAFMVGSKVFYALTDGFLYSRTFSGDTWGPAVKINPYHDPTWANVDDHLGGTFDGNVPTLYGQIPDLTGMFYADGRLYYTLARDTQLRWRWFSPDSGIVDERTFFAPSTVSFRNARGIFVAGDSLYYASTSDGSLNRVRWSGGSVSGVPVPISGPALDGVTWSTRSLFLFSG